MRESEPPYVVCWGEILWDLFPDGALLGGAPANVAYHLAALSRRVIMASRVGDDERGHEALRRLTAHGVDVSCVQLDERLPTGAVAVAIVDGEARYTLQERCAWEQLQLTDPIAEKLAGAAAFCFGTLMQRTAAGRAALAQALARCSSECLIVCDVNLRPAHVDREVLRSSLAAASVVKINDVEASIIESEFSVASAVDWLIDDMNVDIVAATRGPRGSSLHTRDGRFDHPGFAVEVVDTVGAGDAFTAVLVHGLLSGAPLAAVTEAANRYGAFVATQRGATPLLPPAMLTLLQPTET